MQHLFWFDFILGLNLFPFVSNSLSYINLSQKQTGQQNITKDENEPGTILNYMWFSKMYIGLLIAW